MLWDNEDDSKNMQRFKNGMFLKMWVTNETRDAAMPIVAVAALIIVAVMLIASLFQ